MMTAFTPDFAYFVPGQDAFAGGNGIQDSKKIRYQSCFR